MKNLSALCGKYGEYGSCSPVPVYFSHAGKYLTLIEPSKIAADNTIILIFLL